MALTSRWLVGLQGLGDCANTQIVQSDDGINDLVCMDSSGNIISSTLDTSLPSVPGGSAPGLPVGYNPATGTVSNNASGATTTTTGVTCADVAGNPVACTDPTAATCEPLGSAACISIANGWAAASALAPTSQNSMIVVAAILGVALVVMGLVSRK